MLKLALPWAAVVALALVATGCGGSTDAASGPTIRIHFSHFEPSELTVAAGQPVTITLRNDDPIEHEWIVGDAEVHQRHRTGTEPYHRSIPTEVTIPALTTLTTTITFSRPADLQYICHLPHHEQYGMVGTLHIVEE